MKYTTFLYGLLIIFLVFGIYTQFWTDIFTNSNTTISSNTNATFVALKENNELMNKINFTRDLAMNKVKSQSTVSAILDLLGFYFKSGIEMLAIIPLSLKVVMTMLTTTIDSAGSLLGIAYNPLKNFLLLALVVGMTFIIIKIFIQRGDL